LIGEMHFQVMTDVSLGVRPFVLGLWLH